MGPYCEKPAILPTHRFCNCELLSSISSLCLCCRLSLRNACWLPQENPVCSTKEEHTTAYHYTHIILLSLANGLAWKPSGRCNYPKPCFLLLSLPLHVQGEKVRVSGVAPTCPRFACLPPLPPTRTTILGPVKLCRHLRGQISTQWGRKSGGGGGGVRASGAAPLPARKPYRFSSLSFCNEPFISVPPFLKVPQRHFYQAQIGNISKPL